MKKLARHHESGRGPACWAPAAHVEPADGRPGAPDDARDAYNARRGTAESNSYIVDMTYRLQQ